MYGNLFFLGRLVAANQSVSPLWGGPYVRQGILILGQILSLANRFQLTNHSPCNGEALALPNQM